MQSGRQNGFTLMELMITVSIIAILVAVAVPSYSGYVVKGHRTAAKAQMMDIANRQQQFFLANRAYASKTQLQDSGYALPQEVSGRYDYSITVGTGTVPSYTITFTPKAGTGQANDGALTLTDKGVKGCDPACDPISLKW